MRKINTVKKGNLVEIDDEWVKLIIEAKNMGLKLEDVREFLKNGMKDEKQWAKSE